jgi:hypothetical protein
MSENDYTIIFHLLERIALFPKKNQLRSTIHQKLDTSILNN